MSAGHLTLSFCNGGLKEIEGNADLVQDITGKTQTLQSVAAGGFAFTIAC